MSRALLITGATGKQGGALIDALLSSKASSNFDILAVTRNASSPSAKRLAAKSPSIKIVEGDMHSIPALFASAKAISGSVPIWGVYSVQVFAGKGASLESEVRQGKAMVDEAIQNGVEHFVYSSVERGGDARSWDNPTNVPHFMTKHAIEHHLRDSSAKTGSMNWTILRPVIFMENLEPGFAIKVFLTALRNTLKEKPLQWVSIRDIGIAAAQAFERPDEWKNKAFGLATDVLTFDELSKTFETVTGSPTGTTFGFLGSALKYGAPEYGKMINWFRDEGYKADVEENRRFNPEWLSFQEFLKSSAFARRG